MFKGCYTALITPFRDGQVDEEAFQALVQWQIDQGVHGLVPCGTHGRVTDAQSSGTRARHRALHRGGQGLKSRSWPARARTRPRRRSA